MFWLENYRRVFLCCKYMYYKACRNISELNDCIKRRPKKQEGSKFEGTVQVLLSAIVLVHWTKSSYNGEKHGNS